jgi:hypothetical protein
MLLGIQLQVNNLIIFSTKSTRFSKLNNYCRITEARNKIDIKGAQSDLPYCTMRDPLVHEWLNPLTSSASAAKATANGACKNNTHHMLVLYGACHLRSRPHPTALQPSLPHCRIASTSRATPLVGSLGLGIGTAGLSVDHTVNKKLPRVSSVRLQRCCIPLFPRGCTSVHLSLVLNLIWICLTSSCTVLPHFVSLCMNLLLLDKLMYLGCWNL